MAPDVRLELTHGSGGPGVLADGRPLPVPAHTSPTEVGLAAARRHAARSGRELRVEVVDGASVTLVTVGRHGAVTLLEPPATGPVPVVTGPVAPAEPLTVADRTAVHVLPPPVLSTTPPLPPVPAATSAWASPAPASRPRRPVSSLVVAALVAVAVLVGAVGTGVATLSSSHALPDACRPVTLYAVGGQGGSADVLRGVTDPLAKQFGEKVSVVTVPAPPTGGSFASAESDAVGSLANAVGEHVDGCPSGSLMLFGYSQGAQVAGDLASRVGTGLEPRIPAKLVQAVGLFGDPARSPRTRAVPDGTTGQGALPPRAVGFGSLDARTIEICAPDDPVCDSPPTAAAPPLEQAVASPVHGSYEKLPVAAGTTAPQWAAASLGKVVAAIPADAGPAKTPPGTAPQSGPGGSTASEDPTGTDATGTGAADTDATSGSAAGTGATTTGTDATSGTSSDTPSTGSGAAGDAGAVSTTPPADGTGAGAGGSYEGGGSSAVSPTTAPSGSSAAGGAGEGAGVSTRRSGSASADGTGTSGSGSASGSTGTGSRTSTSDTGSGTSGTSYPSGSGATASSETGSSRPGSAGTSSTSGSAGTGSESGTTPSTTAPPGRRSTGTGSTGTGSTGTGTSGEHGKGADTGSGSGTSGTGAAGSGSSTPSSTRSSSGSASEDPTTTTTAAPPPARGTGSTTTRDSGKDGKDGKDAGKGGKDTGKAGKDAGKDGKDTGKGGKDTGKKTSTAFSLSGGLTGFKSTPWNNQGATDPSSAASPNVPGRKAVKFEMPGGGKRTEAEPDIPEFTEGQKAFVGYSGFFDQGFPTNTDTWQLIMQFKQPGTGSPPLAVEVGKGQLRLANDGGGEKDFCPVTQGAFSFQLGVTFGGAIDAWCNGKQTLTGYTTPKPNVQGSAYLKTGIYRDESIKQDSTLFLNDLKVGTTLDSVSGLAGAGSGTTTDAATSDPAAPTKDPAAPTTGPGGTADQASGAGAAVPTTTAPATAAPAAPATAAGTVGTVGTGSGDAASGTGTGGGEPSYFTAGTPPSDPRPRRADGS